jgi:hypothetical protein
MPIELKKSKGGQWRLPALTMPGTMQGLRLCTYFPELEADDCDWALALGTLT